MRFLRTNTAVIISVGPFYDRTDGVTPETALTITNERITLVAETDDNSAPTLVLDNITGATSGTSNDLNYITGQDNGMMQMELSAANTNRVGRMMLTITDGANHVPVFHEFMVMPALVYDTFFAASGGATFPAATLASTTNITAGTITTATNVTTVNGLAAGVITATSIAADAITAAKVADGTIDAATFAAGAINAAAIASDAITDAKVAADVTIASVTGAVGSVTGAVGSVTGNVGGNVVGSVGSVTGLTAANLDVAVSTRLATAGYTAPDNTSIAAILVDTGTTLDAKADAIQAKTDQLTFTTANVLDVNVENVNNGPIQGDGSASDPWRKT